MVKLRKIFATSVMIMTVFSLSMVTAPSVDAAAKAGDLIKMDGLSSVYYLGADGKRYVFPNESTYFSWYKDFSTVVTISQSELESYPLGANVTVRPGTKLVKITTNPTVYAVEPGGNLRAIASESDANTLYGANWNKRIIDVPDAFFTNYKTGTALASGKYPAGQLVKTASNATIYYFDGTNYRTVDSETAFLANGFNFDNVVTTSMSVTAGGTSIIGAESALTDLSNGAGGTAGAGTGLTVSLAGTTPASGTIIDGTAATTLAAFNLTAANDGAVKVTTIKVKRGGITSDSTLSAVYLYDGATRLTDSASVSSGYVTFTNSSGIITVPAGTTKTITVKSNIADSTSGQTVNVSINAATDVVTDGASVSGSFPVSGNIMSIASASLATVDLSGTVTPTTNTSVDIQNDYTMWESTATVGTRAVNLNSIRFRQIGSVRSSDIGNFRLYVDGSQVGSAVASLDSNGYVNFDLSASPKKLETGARTIKVVGDVLNGSTYTFSLSLRQSADIEVSDTEYGANVLSTVASATFSAQTSGTQTISSGSLSVVKASDSTAGNVVDSASDVVLAKYTLTAYGEPIKIETLTVRASSSDYNVGSLRNGRLLVNGVQFGNTTAIASSTTGTEFSGNVTVTPGTPATLEIRADIHENVTGDDDLDSDTLTAILLTDTNNAQRANSLGFIDVPSASTNGNTLTVTTGTITLSKTGSYGDRNIVLPSTAYKLASFVLSGNNAENVNLNNINVSFAASGTFANTNLTDVYVTYGGTTGSIKSTIGSGTSTWSISKTLAKAETMTIDVFANISNTPTSTNGITTYMIVTGTTATSGSSVTTAYTAGQALTVAAGSMTTSVDASSPAIKQVVGDSTVDVAAYKFAAANDSYTITEITATTTASGTSAIVSASLKDGNTVLATAPFAGSQTVTFSGLNVAVPANGSKVLTVALNLGTIGAGAGTTGANVKTTLATYKVNNSQGVQSTQTDESSFASREGNAVYAFKSKATISNATLPSSALAAGTNTLAKVNVAADAKGDISWKVIEFTVAKSANPTIATSTFALYDGTTQVTGTISSTGDSLAATSSGSATIRFTATTAQTISAGSSKTYSLKATVGGTLSTGHSVYTNIATPSSYAAPAAYAAGTVSAKSFAWSDMSANSHSESTADWNNDYKVDGLATDSQALSL